MLWKFLSGPGNNHTNGHWGEDVIALGIGASAVALGLIIGRVTNNQQNPTTRGRRAAQPAAAEPATPAASSVPPSWEASPTELSPGAELAAVAAPFAGNGAAAALHGWHQDVLGSRWSPRVYQLPRRMEDFDRWLNL